VLGDCQADEGRELVSRTDREQIQAANVASGLDALGPKRGTQADAGVGASDQRQESVCDRLRECATQVGRSLGVEALQNLCQNAVTFEMLLEFLVRLAQPFDLLAGLAVPLGEDCSAQELKLPCASRRLSSVSAKACADSSRWAIASAMASSLTGSSGASRSSASRAASMAARAVGRPGALRRNTSSRPSTPSRSLRKSPCACASASCCRRTSSRASSAAASAASPSAGKPSPPPRAGLQPGLRPKLCDLAS
jgi:hypothetical protein